MDTRKKGRLSNNHANMTKKGIDVVSLYSRHKGTKGNILKLHVRQGLWENT